MPERKIATRRSLLTYPADWSPDSRVLLFRQLSRKTDWDLWTIAVNGDAPQVPYLQTPFGESSACFSPNGRWVCYSSDESGEDEIYVQAFPAPGRKYKVSSGGGSYPFWSADGRMIAYSDGSGRLTTIGVRTDGGAFSSGVPNPRFAMPGLVGGDLSGDFSRVLLSVEDEQHRTPGEMTVLLNWRRDLAGR